MVNKIKPYKARILYDKPAAESTWLMALVDTLTKLGPWGQRVVLSHKKTPGLLTVHHAPWLPLARLVLSERYKSDAITGAMLIGGVVSGSKRMYNGKASGM